MNDTSVLLSLRWPGLSGGRWRVDRDHEYGTLRNLRRCRPSFGLGGTVAMILDFISYFFTPLSR